MTQASRQLTPVQNLPRHRSKARLHHYHHHHQAMHSRAAFASTSRPIIRACFAATSVTAPAATKRWLARTVPSAVLLPSISMVDSVACLRYAECSRAPDYATNIGFLGKWGTYACPQCLPSDIAPIRSWTWTLRLPGIRHKHLPYHTIPCARYERHPSVRMMVCTDRGLFLFVFSAACNGASGPLLCVYLLNFAYNDHTIPYHTIPYHTIPYHTIPYHTVP